MALKLFLFIALIIQCILGVFASPLAPALVAENTSSVALAARNSGLNIRVFRRPIRY